MLTDQVALVTGASRGLGRAIALELAKNGAHVIVNYAGNKELAEEVVQEIKKLGRESFAVRADVASEKDVKEMVKQVTDSAIQIHGGMGYMMETPVQRYWRDARAMSIIEETTQDMNEYLINLLGIPSKQTI